MANDDDAVADDNQQEAYYKYQQEDQWTDSDEGIDLYFVIFLSLLAIVLVLSKYLHDYPKVATVLPEAGMIIIVGTIAGSIIHKSISDDDQDQYYNSNVNENVAKGLLSFSPSIFFFILLPPIIFNSGYTLKREVFFRHIMPISLFAIFGTAISTFVVAIILQIVKKCGLFGDFSPRFTELLTFGALISATDPVSTLAVFQAKKVDPQLFYLVFGESVLNDAVGLVLFKTLSKFVGAEENVEKVVVVIFEFLVDFSVGFIGSMVLGLFSGLGSAFFLKIVDMRQTPLLELSLFFLIMYLPFFFAEYFELSGIVTILFTGISARRYATHNLSEATDEAVDSLFHLIAHLAETSIFLELGMSVIQLGDKFSYEWKFVTWSILACLIGRAMNVYPLRSLYNMFLLRKIEAAQQLEIHPQTLAKNLSGESEAETLTPLMRKDLKVRNKTAHMLWFSGLRGAVAYACAKTFPNHYGNKPAFVFTTMGVVLFTVFIFGCTTDCALHALKIEMNVDEEKYMEENKVSDKMDFINVFEKRFIYPYILRDYSGKDNEGVELQNVSVVGEMSLDGSNRSWLTVGSPTQTIARSVRFDMLAHPYRMDRMGPNTVRSGSPRRKSMSIYDYGLGSKAGVRGTSRVAAHYNRRSRMISEEGDSVAT